MTLELSDDKAKQLREQVEGWRGMLDNVYVGLADLDALLNDRDKLIDRVRELEGDAAQQKALAENRELFEQLAKNRHE